MFRCFLSVCAHGMGSHRVTAVVARSWVALWLLHQLEYVGGSLGGSCVSQNMPPIPSSHPASIAEGRLCLSIDNRVFFAYSRSLMSLPTKKVSTSATIVCEWGLIWRSGAPITSLIIDRARHHPVFTILHLFSPNQVFLYRLSRSGSTW